MAEPRCRRTKMFKSICDCGYCRSERNAARPRNWGDRTVGSIDGEEVTFRQGEGDRKNHTLISDGQKSAREFDRQHNHYGPKSEGGRIEDDGGDRGHYTGPGR